MAHALHSRLGMVLALFSTIKRSRAFANDTGDFRVYDVLFEDVSWKMKQLVVSVGYLPPHKVLVPADAIRSLDGVRERIDLSISRDEVTHEPLERDHPPMSEGPILESFCFQAPIGPGVFPIPMHMKSQVESEHLWSARDLLGYRVCGTDRAVGIVHDFVIDPKTWAVRSLVVQVDDKQHHQVLIEPALIERIHWLGAAVHLTIDASDAEKRPNLVVAPIEAAA